MRLIPVDKKHAALQLCSVTAISISKRGTITLPPGIRKALGLDLSANPMMLAELRDGGVFLHPAQALPVRDIPIEKLREWVAEDEEGAEAFWAKVQ